MQQLYEFALVSDPFTELVLKSCSVFCNVFCIEKTIFYLLDDEDIVDCLNGLN